MIYLLCESSFFIFLLTSNNNKKQAADKSVVDFNLKTNFFVLWELALSGRGASSASKEKISVFFVQMLQKKWKLTSSTLYLFNIADSTNPKGELSYEEYKTALKAADPNLTDEEI